MRDVINFFLRRFGIDVFENGSDAFFPPLRQCTTSHSRAPRWFEIGTADTEYQSVYPHLSARVFVDVRVNPSSVAIRKKQSVFVPEYFFRNRDRYDFSGGFIRKIRKNYVKIKDFKTEEICDGVALFGLGSRNWYHWLVDILPCAMLAGLLPQEHDQLPFLVPEECVKTNSFKEALHSVNSSRGVVPMRHDRIYKVKRLVVIDSPVRIPFNLFRNLWPVPNDFEQHTEVIRDFKTLILNRLGIKESHNFRRIFIARGNARREYNQEEILRVASELNLEIIYPERMSFLEQVSVFFNAKLIVGASGAAWANLLFCQPGTIGLTWIFKEYSGFSTYMNLAGISGVDLKYIEARSKTPLRSPWEAYEASYHVCPDLLRRAVNAVSEV